MSPQSVPSLLLYPALVRKLGLVAVCGGFTVIGVAMIRDGHPSGWWVAGGFGVGLGIAVVQCLPFASSMRLDAEGMTIRALYRSRTYRWSEIEGFGTAWVGPSRRVVYNLVLEPGARPTASRRLMGMDAMLPESYGLSPEALSDLLNDWKLGHHRSPQWPSLRERLQQWTATLPESPLGLLLLKIAALFSYCGGPLLFSSHLKPWLGDMGAFIATFSPIVLVLLGALALRDRDNDRWGVLSIRAGQIGAAALAVINIVALFVLWRGPASADAGLILVGIVVGWLTAVGYGWAAHHHLRALLDTRLETLD